MDTLDGLRKLFENPPDAFRSAPFWAWNDRLEAPELSRQARDMKAHGMGGFFMHSREGLETEYMGPEWMACIRETVKTAKETGMQAWLYDEDRWPSGFAGGSVPSGGDAFRAKGLTIELAAGDYAPDAQVCALFAATVDGMSLLRCERLETDRPHALRGNGVHLVFRVEVCEGYEWFNNESPPDNLNPASIREFIRTTYERYKQAVGEEFGKTIPGIFTDEPSVNDRHCKFSGGRGWMPWTYGFPGFFSSRRGYDLLDRAPYLFFNGEASPEVRHDYWRTVTELFCHAYSEQLGSWCEENNLSFTGHFLQEDKLGLATRVSGAVMPHYRYQHVPGIDLLCERTEETVTVKQCTSVANQYGRKRVLSETYGCTGWEFTFEGQKWLGDWQYVMGVNLRCQHLALYSLKGCRKRDYPPVFNYNTSWWKYNQPVEDYFARIGAVMAQGDAVRDVLVLHPASTAWSMLGANPYGIPARGRDRDIPAVNRYGEEYNRFLRYLLGMHYDFDLGDEIIMAETARVDANTLFVNRAGYRVVILPSVKTMLKSTLELLNGFMEAGGKVIAVRPAADLLEGRKSDAVTALYGHRNMTVLEDPYQTAATLEKLLPRSVSIRNRQGAEIPELLYLLKELADCRTLFIVNNSRDAAHTACITVDGAGLAEEWDPLTGERKAPEVSFREGGLQIHADFPPAASRLYILRKGEPRAGQHAEGKCTAPVRAEEKKVYAFLGPESRFTRMAPNLLVLDRCAFRVKEGGWSDETEVWQAQRKLREMLGMRQNYYNGQLQRYRWIHEPHRSDGTPVKFRFRFCVAEVPEKETYLVLEAPEDYRISLNGRAVDSRPEGWFLDRTFGRVRLPALEKGVNELVLSCRYLNRMEVEDCYILGDFGVDLHRNIIREPEILHFGDWCLQGYFHYCGSMVYHFALDWDAAAGAQAVLELGDYSAVTAEVRVNGAAAGHIPWRAANGLDITKFLAEGKNTIDIEVMGSPRNMFGPFHHAGGHALSTDWSSFRSEDREYTAGYIVQPYGLFGQVKIYRK